MNKFSPGLGGHPLVLDDFMLMQNAYTDALTAIIDSISPTGNCILKGMLVTVGISNITYTDGYVAIAGEVFKVTGSSFAKSLNPSDVLYLNPVETPVPPDPTTYQDTSVKNVHLQRTAVLKYKQVSDTQGIEHYKCLSRDAGDIRDWFPVSGTQVTDFFDTTGLGIGIKEGWALCNGLNGTPDLRGFYTAMATDAPSSGAGALSGLLSGVANTLADRIGAGKITLTVANLPAYQLSVTDNGHTHAAAFANYINTAQSGSGTNIATLGTNPAPAITLNGIVQTSTTGIVVNSGGGGQGFENRPPTYYLYKVMKLR